MSSSYGKNIRVTIFGQSHSPAIGVTIEGLPSGEKVDMEALQSFLARRAPGKNAWSTPRKEADLPEFLSGIVDDTLCGTPLTAIIRNTNTRSGDYSQLKIKPRPGHADYTAEVKYFGAQDYAGGGHFSGRLTAPLCIAGGICRQLLEKEGITIISRIASIGKIRDEGALSSSTAEKDFPVVNDACGEKMKELIAQARENGDSVGGTVECVINGLPTGLGDPMFDGMENRLAQIIFGIPAVKGLEFGAGFGVAEMFGSECNDEMYFDEGTVKTKTNNCGGILGGITNGMPLSFRVAFKPTPSISKQQNTVDLSENKNTELSITGRHDPCIVARAVPVVEAAAAIAVFDALKERKAELSFHRV